VALVTELAAECDQQQAIVLTALATFAAN